MLRFLKFVELVHKLLVGRHFVGLVDKLFIHSFPSRLLLSDIVKQRANVSTAKRIGCRLRNLVPCFLGELERLEYFNIICAGSKLEQDLFQGRFPIVILLDSLINRLLLFKKLERSLSVGLAYLSNVCDQIIFLFRVFADLLIQLRNYQLEILHRQVSLRKLGDLKSLAKRCYSIKLNFLTRAFLQFVIPHHILDYDFDALLATLEPAVLQVLLDADNQVALVDNFGTAVCEQKVSTDVLNQFQVDVLWLRLFSF